MLALVLPAVDSPETLRVWQLDTLDVVGELTSRDRFHGRKPRFDSRHSFRAHTMRPEKDEYNRHEP